MSMWLRVSHAGYCAAEESPVFLAILGAPARVAGWLSWLLP
ncbi:MAG: hypothetical protein ACLQFF_04455 [Steroidobacteraceae bacterium]